MSVETRPRSTSDGGRDERAARLRRDQPYRGYGAYTAGTSALRIDPAVDPDLDPAFDTNADAGDELAPQRIDTEGIGTSAPGRTRRPAPARVPRPRRRTPWVSDVTPAPAPATESDAPPLPVRLPKAPFLMLLAGLVVVGVVGVLVLQTKINESSFRLTDLRSTQAALDQQEQQLEQQLADLSQPGSLSAAAARLGLVPAGTQAFISLPDGRIVGVPQPAGR